MADEVEDLALAEEEEEEEAMGEIVDNASLVFSKHNGETTGCPSTLTAAHSYTGHRGGLKNYHVTKLLKS